MTTPGQGGPGTPPNPDTHSEADPGQYATAQEIEDLEASAEAQENDIASNVKTGSDRFPDTGRPPMR
jgi:hypothetical protein